MRSGFGVMVVVAALAMGTGCGWFGSSAPVTLRPDAPDAVPTLPVVELGPSMGATAMAGLIGEVNGTPVITTCDGIERVRITPADETKDALIELSKKTTPTFALIRGDRRRRTVEDIKVGLDGTLEGGVLMQGRPAKDGDCGVPDLASNPLFHVPRDGEIAFFKPDVLAVKATWKLAAEVADRPGMGRTAEDAIEARLLEVTLGWCDGADKARVDGFGVNWEVTSASDKFLGAWRVSCGRARNSVLRAGKSVGTPYALTLDGAPTTFNVPLLGLDRADRALAFGAWTLGLHPECAGEKCPEGMTPKPPGERLHLNLDAPTAPEAVAPTPK